MLLGHLTRDLELTCDLEHNVLKPVTMAKQHRVVCTRHMLSCLSCIIEHAKYNN